MNEYERRNRERLVDILDRIPKIDCPVGWRKVGTFAVGGLESIGFSKKSDLLLIVSSQGRGVIDPTSGKNVARDDESTGSWLDERYLTCQGTGPLAGERIQLAGIGGGGLPLGTSHGESLHLVAPDWPIYRLIYCGAFGDPLSDRHQSSCVVIASDHMRAYGFSWSGDAFAYATGSDVTIFSRMSGGS
jgi:hypothetical protein